MGDLIDGKFINGSDGNREKLREIVDTIEGVRDNPLPHGQSQRKDEEEAGAKRMKKVFHCLGNHELYCFSKSDLCDIFRTPRWYYSDTISTTGCPLSPPLPWKIVVLDSYEFSCLDSSTEASAYAYLSERNRNVVRGQDTGMCLFFTAPTQSSSEIRRS